MDGLFAFLANSSASQICSGRAGAVPLTAFYCSIDQLLQRSINKDVSSLIDYMQTILTVVGIQCKKNGEQSNMR